MKVQISGDWNGGSTIPEVVEACKNAIRVLEDITMRPVVVVTTFNDVPIVVRKDTPVASVGQSYEYFSTCQDNKRQDLIDRYLAELTEGA
jgi:hypothetical protein